MWVFYWSWRNIRSGNNVLHRGKFVINCFFSLSSLWQTFICWVPSLPLGLASCIPSALEHPQGGPPHFAAHISQCPHLAGETCCSWPWMCGSPQPSPNLVQCTAPERCRFSEGVRWVLGKENVSSQMCHYLALFLFGSIPSPVWPEIDHSPRACQHFYGFFVHFGQCFQFIGVLPQLSFKGKCTQVGGKVFSDCYSFNNIYF